ncbi:MAG: M20/M25/M40 family metallo-hydrolase, partial [Verrucomicrobia bacterium]|nr:M20/M25/M40 family metallo-hydrolase [Verrucomicrobiota bacterium]
IAGGGIFARIFEAEGIAYESAESAPGRGNIWARLKGGSEPTLVLLNHTDVVPADEEFWESDPLSGEIKDGYIYGRGALDMKGTGIAQLQAFLALHRSGKPLNRDVIWMGTADEEAGGFFGAGWLVENKPELFEDVGLLLNEGGGGSLNQDGEAVFAVEMTQKVPFWIRLKATGKSGHGSVPHAESAVTRLVEALHRIYSNPFTPRITEPVDTYFKALAPHVEEEWQEAFSDMATAIKDPAFVHKLQEWNNGYHALTRNTISITMLEGSSKINVVPPDAFAELDCRILPDQDPEEFLNQLRFIIDDPNIALETIMVFTPAVSSPDTPLYRAIDKVIGKHFPEAPIVPNVGRGFTDSHFFRDLGIACYGFSPTLIPAEDRSGVHGNNERISVENIHRSVRLTLEIVQQVVY